MSSCRACFILGGNPAQVLALALAGAVEICYSDSILAEYREVLARPRFKLDAERVNEVLMKFEEDGVSVTTNRTDLNLPDTDDEPFLAVALEAKADYLVTGNIRDFPAEKRKGCAIVTPAELMQIWNSARSQS
jgi:putative PIN family toxin of toxin-antitoxin system